MYNWASSAYRGEGVERAKEKEGRREKVEESERVVREGKRESKVGRKQLPLYVHLKNHCNSCQAGGDGH